MYVETFAWLNFREFRKWPGIRKSLIRENAYLHVGGIYHRAPLVNIKTRIFIRESLTARKFQRIRY